MKCEWKFFFETRGFRFERKHNFRGSLREEHRRVLGLDENIDEFQVDFVPHSECMFHGAEQSGDLHLVLRGDPEQTREPALRLALRVAQQVSFNLGGELKVLGGLVTGRRIAETENERSAIGEAPYFAEAHMEEYEEPKTFDPSALNSIVMDGPISVAMIQFNSAIQANNIVDRFLGLFKVLESLFTTKKSDKLSRKLCDSIELRAVADEFARARGWSMSGHDYQSLIKDLMMARDQCAHLRAKCKQGVVSGMPEVSTKVEPLADVLKEMAYRSLIRLRAESVPLPAEPFSDPDLP